MSPESLHPVEQQVRANLEAIQTRMRDACARAGRPLASVQLMAVTKTVSVPAIRAAVLAGVRLLGENRVQEWEEKRPQLADLLHRVGASCRLIGHLQSNKANRAVQLFDGVTDGVDSVDGLRLAERLNAAAAQRGYPLPVLLEINIGREPQKAGGLPEDALRLAEAVMALPALRLEGLLIIPPQTADPEQSRPYFAALRTLSEELCRRLTRPSWTLSMGMSHDYPVAIEEGATVVRVGSALFGARHITP